MCSVSKFLSSRREGDSVCDEEREMWCSENLYVIDEKERKLLYMKRGRCGVVRICM